MKNKFTVKACCYCKKAVEAGAGSVWKWNGRWYGKHAGCTKADRVARVSSGFPHDEPGTDPGPTAEAQGFKVGGWYNDGEAEVERRQRAHDDAEYAKGVASVDRWRENKALFGEAYADAEEFAWDLKDPDPAY